MQDDYVNGGYRISEASRMVGLHPRTLMLYERLGLVMPQRQGQQRRYTDDDLRWVGCIQEINHRCGVSLAGMRAFLRYLPCWALRSITPQAQDVSPGRFDPQTAAREIEQVLNAGAPDYCDGCGYSQSVDPQSTRIRYRPKS